jgi:hypothetical protein
VDSEANNFVLIATFTLSCQMREPGDGPYGRGYSGFACVADRLQRRLAYERFSVSDAASRLFL